jgi:redox-sensitive bicupin YhaK (pirin superfamily)
MYVAALDEGTEVTHKIGRGLYVYLIEGTADFDAYPVTSGDAAKVTDQPDLTITAHGPSELVLVDVSMRFEPVGVWRNYL